MSWRKMWITFLCAIFTSILHSFTKLNSKPHQLQNMIQRAQPPKKTTNMDLISVNGAKYIQ